MSAQRLLDRVQSLAAADALDPGDFASALAAELPGNPSQIDEAIAPVLEQIDALVVRVMRLRLDHALATDGSIAPPTRRVFAQTIASYDGRLPLLADRARDVAARGGARDADEIAERVVGAARTTLEQRAALRAGVLALRKDPEPEPELLRELTREELLELD